MLQVVRNSKWLLPLCVYIYRSRYSSRGSIAEDEARVLWAKIEELKEKEQKEAKARAKIREAEQKAHEAEQREKERLHEALQDYIRQCRLQDIGHVTNPYLP
jgi:predicted Holliday junction resolvase-like endonuclease